MTPLFEIVAFRLGVNGSRLVLSRFAVVSRMKLKIDFFKILFSQFEVIS